MSCASPHASRSFASERNFLLAKADGIELQSGTGVYLISPKLQGRVMTSAVDPTGQSLGFVNRAEIEAAPETAPFINYGGEDRFWLGPEGGRFSVFFAPGQDQVLDNWQTPHEIHTGAFEVVDERTGSGPNGVERLEAVTMQRKVKLGNASATAFEVGIQRTLETPSESEVAALLGGSIPTGTQWVAFRSRNRITNRGDQRWSKESGLLSIWTLGMFQAGENSFAILPYRNGDGSEPPVQTAYFGEIPAERLRPGSSFVLFKADAHYRSKIGLYRDHAPPVVGAYDPDAGILTLVRYGPFDPNGDYVNSLWELDQAQPFNGDVINSYNHSGPEPFFELETSSPARELGPGESIEHEHMTVHLRVPDDAALAEVVRAALGLEWDEVATLAGW